MPKKALFITADMFEDTELLYPYYRLKEEGFQVDVAAPQAGQVKGKKGYEVAANLSLEEARKAGADAYVLLVIPGGKAPAAIRDKPEAKDIAKAFAAKGKPMAAICHGPQVLVSAGLMQGRTATCYPSVAPEVTNAGGNYQDEEVVVDGNLVTSRKPDDLPAFMREVLRLLGGKEASV